MDLENFSLSFVSLGLMYPERPRFEGDDLPKLYAELAKRFEFESLQHDRDGARIQQEGQWSIGIFRTALIADVLAAQSIDVVSRELIDVVEIIQRHLRIRIFWEPRIVLRALCPVEVENSEEGTRPGVTALTQGASALSHDRLALLRANRIDGVGLNVDVTDDHEGSTRHTHVVIGTYARDPSQLYIEMDLSQHQQLEGASELNAWIEIQHSRFTNDVLRFASSTIRFNGN